MLVWAPRELELRTHRPGLRGVQNQPGRAGPRGHGQLEVADVHVEPGQVEGGSASRELGLGSHLVVPCRLVFPGPRDPAVCERVRGGAQRLVEGIVDAAKPKAPRGLGVEREGVRCLVAHDEARRDAVRVSRACGGGRDGKDAVEDQRAILVEVVVAQTGGEVESISGGPGWFARGGGPLLIVVAGGKKKILHPRAPFSTPPPPPAALLPTTGENTP